MPVDLARAPEQADIHRAERERPRRRHGIERQRRGSRLLSRRAERERALYDVGVRRQWIPQRGRERNELRGRGNETRQQKPVEPPAASAADHSWRAAAPAGGQQWVLYAAAPHCVSRAGRYRRAHAP